MKIVNTILSVIGAVTVLIAGLLWMLSTVNWRGY